MRPSVTSGLSAVTAIVWLSFSISGCVAPETHSDAESRLGSPLTSAGDASLNVPTADRAVIDPQGNLLIAFSDETRSQAAAVALAETPPPAAHKQAIGPPTRSLKITEELPEGRPVEVRAIADWQLLLHNLAVETAALVADQGIVLDLLHENELFLYLEENGELQAVPLSAKPPAIKPAFTLSLPELLLGGFQRIRDGTPGNDMLLFNTGDPAYPFVLMRLAREEVIFLNFEPGNRSTGTLHAPAHAAQAAVHTLTSQVRSLATQPFSTLARFLTGVATTPVDTLPQLALLGAATDIPPLNPDPEPMAIAAWEEALDGLVPGSGTQGRIDYLVDGRRFFPELIHEIGAAKEAIRIRLYIFDNDDYALRIADQLKQRSAELPVRILLDGLGTITGAMAKPAFTPGAAAAGPVSISSYLRTDSDVEVKLLPNPWMQGDHTKVLIFDDHRAFLGGMNIGREYRYEWHDLMASVQGPVVDRLIRDFDNAWRRAGLFGELGLLLSPGEVTKHAATDTNYPLRLLYTRPGAAEILQAQVAALRRAQQRVWVQNAYLTSDTILRELVAARRRGVDVRVILPYRTDAGFIGRSNVLAANLLLRHGVRVYIYPGMSHVKAAVYDGWACFGSANFDRLSLLINRETNIATSYAPAVEQLVNTVFEPDFALAVELSEPLPSSWIDYLSELIADQL